MRETLYIRLGATPDAAVEFGATAADPRTLAVRHGPLDLALNEATGRRLVVFVPATDVRLSAVTVPARQAAKVLQAVPFALEDQVAEDVDSLHFAIGPRQADGSVPVAIVGRARMDAWMAPFLARGLRPEWLVPESLALPMQAAPDAAQDPAELRWGAVADASQAVVRTGNWSGFSCATDDLPAYLSIASGGTEPRPLLRLLVAAGHEGDWSRLAWPLELLPGFAAPLVAFATHLRVETSINLLQGGYAQGQDMRKLWQPWRLAAVLATLWLVLSGSLYVLDNLRLARELEQQDAANLARFQQLFPGETRIVDMSAQLDQQLRALTAGSGSGGLFGLLEALTQALAGNPGLKLTGLQFRDGALFLSMTGRDLDALEGLRNAFTNSRAAALEVQSANAESGTVQIRAKLSPV